MTTRLALNVTEAAEEVRVSASWLRREAKAGRFPCVRLGRRLLFRPEAIQQYLAERETATAR
ncbi:MAG: helix-turn-helix domain-containing protein [Planctomycetia bacterium]|nr:helix-turn-helix domain-containing protein [Planctomycetia bacterium]